MVVDDELVVDKHNRQFLLLFDCIVIDGKLVGNRTLSHRLKILDTEIVKPFQEMCRQRGLEYLAAINMS